MKSLREWFSWAFFPVCLVAPLVLAVYGALSPWSASEVALAASQGNQTKILVGISYRGGSTQDGPYERKARTYAFAPEGFRTLETVSVVQENGNVSTEVQRFGLVVPLLAFMLGVFGSLWQVSRLTSKHQKASAP